MRVRPEVGIISDPPLPADNGILAHGFLSQSGPLPVPFRCLLVGVGDVQ